MPPATLNAPSVTPSTLKRTVPVTAKVVRMKKAVQEARRAIRARLSSVSLRVIATKIGMTPIGSTTKNTAESDRMLKLKSSRTQGAIPRGLVAWRVCHLPPGGRQFLAPGGFRP